MCNLIASRQNVCSPVVVPEMSDAEFTVCSVCSVSSTPSETTGDQQAVWSSKEQQNVWMLIMMMTHVLTWLVINCGEM